MHSRKKKYFVFRGNAVEGFYRRRYVIAIKKEKGLGDRSSQSF